MHLWLLVWENVEVELTLGKVPEPKAKMKSESTKKNKHLPLEYRIEIQGCLHKGMTFMAMARRVEKDQTTISKEIKNTCLLRQAK